MEDINNDTKRSAKSNAVQAKGTIKTMFDTVRFLIDCGGRSCGVVWYGTVEIKGHPWMLPEWVAYEELLACVQKLAHDLGSLKVANLSKLHDEIKERSVGHDLAKKAVFAERGRCGAYHFLSAGMAEGARQCTADLARQTDGASRFFGNKHGCHARGW